ncbi:thymidine kinase [Butyrivibrio sp. INlla18]|jgi:thymidine kinase|uniref:Thymidine kinase n=1 Tax=Butyrivibrio hungatei DSM 14810 TaxID=1121132 RepID=A0A1M7SEE3_9FIRM|nr:MULTISPECIES: thymidine kinase [Butyrivibrio]MBE5842001.1 thymidine kinase [Butyrivibrio sp.]MCR4758352.1 thymidine kinase [Butyrivibrio sp.]SDA61910.1 thymidine kinase [Butyrivibrio sp. INlla18]SHN56858.1 thymidine kinase [Butyrivibrio hungatei DSM 14810]
MGKLYFRYGAMGSSKTANALMVRYNYIEKGQNAILLKPKADNRDGDTTIRSRIGLSAECTFVEDFLDEVKNEWYTGKSNAWDKLDCVIVDEAQFLTEEQVDLLAEIVDKYDLPVICYGLRTDFTSHLFSGSKRLMEIANYIEEVPTVCWCGRRAHFNARVSNGKIVRSGEQIMMGGNESYVSLCRRHFLSGEVDGAREREI